MKEPPSALHVPLPQRTSPLTTPTSDPASGSSPQAHPPPPPGIVVFSGGSAANKLVDVFEEVRASAAPAGVALREQRLLSYVIPISDNGGSSSEIIRVFGGPGIGDVRSRLVRLIPSTGDLESVAIDRFFNYRLPRSPYGAAKADFHDLLEGTHDLWQGISSPKRELIRSYLNVFHMEATKRMRPTSRFDFAGASLGNLFLTGARLFTGSFEAAVYLLSAVCRVPDRVAVLPALNSNFAHHIAASIADGSIITGQNDISHPSAPSAAVPVPAADGSRAAIGGAAAYDGRKNSTQSALVARPDEAEDANLPGTLPALRRPAINYSKEDEIDLPARIEKIWYINPYGHEIRLPANPRVLEALADADTIIYSIGSLFTSVIPSLILRGVGDAIARPSVRNRILILNGTIDRETGPASDPMTAIDFVAAIASACSESRGKGPPSEDEYRLYVSHVVYLESSASPKVDRRALTRLGIEGVKVYGRSGPEEGAARYDLKGLTQALQVIVGRADSRIDRSRRNTMVG